jgi:histidinol-phosphate phosphatase family protein
MKFKDDVPVIILTALAETSLHRGCVDMPMTLTQAHTHAFLKALLDYLVDESIQRVIVTTGPEADLIKQHFGIQYKTLAILYAAREEVLGSSGAIKQAFDQFKLTEGVVINGVTLFQISLARMYRFHKQFNARASVAVKSQYNSKNYKGLRWNAYNQIEKFREKCDQEECWINGGVYMINRDVFTNIPSSALSFEQAFFESIIGFGSCYAIPFSNRLIDIRMFEEDKRLQKADKGDQFQKTTKKTIFIDRDGVINKRLPGHYVKRVEDFEFLPGAKKALGILSRLYDYVIIVTNQQGIGKKLMTEKDLEHVHQFMLAELAKNDIHIDAVLFSPDLASDRSPNRKPNVGMAFKAKSIFTDIDWNHAAMIGDSATDIEFGLRMGMHTYLVGDKSSTDLAHERCRDLIEAAEIIKKKYIRKN